MDLESGRPFWSVRNGLIRSYPRLQGRVAADVLVIGAGITGALIADELTRAGFRVVVVDRRDVAAGSTSASTALLQYEMDSSLRELQRWCGPEAAKALYWSGLQSIDQLQKISRELPDSVGFQARPSIYLASSVDDLEELHQECRARQADGLPVEFWDESAVRSAFDFSAPGALFSQGGGQVDPYRLTHALLARVTAGGGRVFDRTSIRDHEADGSGVRFRTDHGEVTAKCAIIAAGYESESFLPQPVASLHSTFAFVSDVVTEFPGWHERCLIWETARPYLYLRTTADGRLLAGGEDTWFRNVRVRDRLLPSRIARLEARVRAMFPRIDFAVDYDWAGTFAETKDGLPFIGPHPQCPGLLFAMCYGGNGITFSVLAAAVLREHLQGRTHPLAEWVAFGRPSLERAARG